MGQLSMKVWEALGRIFTIAGIFSAAAAVAAVWVQLKAFNDAQHQKQIEDWQTSVVYQIIQDGKNARFKANIRALCDRGFKVIAYSTRKNWTICSCGWFL
jgi:hypothetical protein